MHRATTVHVMLAAGLFLPAALGGCSRAASGEVEMGPIPSVAIPPLIEVADSLIMRLARGDTAAAGAMMKSDHPHEFSFAEASAKHELIGAWTKRHLREGWWGGGTAQLVFEVPTRSWRDFCYPPGVNDQLLFELKYEGGTWWVSSMWTQIC